MFLSDTLDRLDNNPGLLIFLSIIIVLITAGLIYLLYRSVKKEAKKYKDEKSAYIEGLLTKSEMLAEIGVYLSRASEVTEFALLFINLDKFTNVINAFGQEEADQILQKVAFNLLEALPQRTELSRFVDDQFCVFIKGGYDKSETLDIANTLLEAVRKPIRLFGESTVTVTASIGVAFYPNHGRNVKELMESLNMAQYLSKRDGGDQYTVYSRELGQNESENYEYYHQIKNAIKNKEFALYYQPIINCKTNDIYGVEGLLRWNHPEHGVLSPFKFINIMEQSGDIKWVGEWGLETLVIKWTELKNKFPEKDLILSMNLSPKQLASPTIAQDYQRIARKYRIPPKKITLEVEEFALFDKLDMVQQNIKLLNELGFGIAVDGFGLDYSALTKLEQMPIDIIKLDNDFVDPESDTYLKERFANLLVGYAKQNDKTIICEGVEDKDMLDRAIGKNITIVQGYYFSKPISSDEVEQFIRNKNWERLLLEEELEENTPEEEKEDAPVDMTEDAPVDVTEDTPVDVTEDAPVDVTEDAPVDVTEDTPIDVTEDAPVDVTEDAPVDVTEDAPVDVTEDAPVDVTEDAPVDVTEDTPVNVTEDTPVNATEDTPEEVNDEAFKDEKEAVPEKVTEEAESKKVETSKTPKKNAAPKKTTTPKKNAAPKKTTTPKKATTTKKTSTSKAKAKTTTSKSTSKAKKEATEKK